MKHLILCLFLAACASSPDTPPTYERGTYRPAPRAPAFEPNHEAPHTFRPGQPSPVLEPAPRPAPVPHTPQTQREDTIWASGSPRTSGELEFFEVKIEPPPEDLDYDRMYAASCVSKMDRAIAPTKAAVLSMQMPARTCLMKWLVEMCLRREAEYYSRRLHAGIINKTTAERWLSGSKPARDKAVTDKQTACRNKSDKDTAAPFAHAVRNTTYPAERGWTEVEP